MLSFSAQLKIVSTCKSNQGTTFESGNRYIKDFRKKKTTLIKTNVNIQSTNWGEFQGHSVIVGGNAVL